MESGASSLFPLLALCVPALAQATWVEEAKLLLPDGTYNADFGWSVALSGTTALIGAPQHLDRGSGTLPRAAEPASRAGATRPRRSRAC